MPSTYFKRGIAPPCKGGCDAFWLGRQLQILCHGTQWNTRVLIHILEEVFVISWVFILRRGVHFKDVYQAGGITPTVATLVVALSSHSVSSHPN